MYFSPKCSALCKHDTQTRDCGHLPGRPNAHKRTAPSPTPVVHGPTRLYVCGVCCTGTALLYSAHGPMRASSSCVAAWALRAHLCAAPSRCHKGAAAQLLPPTAWDGASAVLHHSPLWQDRRTVKSSQRIDVQYPPAPLRTLMHREACSSTHASPPQAAALDTAHCVARRSL